MEFWLWVSLVILLAVILGLCLKVHFLRKSAGEIEQEFARRMDIETNTLISISSGDKKMKKLAAALNEELIRLREQRLRFQRGDLELKNAVTNISHDLRTPLTAIYGYLELLEGEEKSEASERYLAQIENRTNLMKQLTEDLFRYSVISSVNEEEPEKMDLRSALEESLISFYGAMEQQGITPELAITEKPVERVLAPTAVSRIFSNIISNVLKYSDGDLKVTLNSSGTIIFANHAKNMDAVTAARLFDRFYTVENARSSTGLGLSIAKLLTERMGGSITSEYAGEKLYIIVSFKDKK